MIPYIIFLILILYLFYANRPRWMLFVIIVFAIMRYNTGWDYNSYVTIIEHPNYWNNPDSSKYPWFWRNIFSIAFYLKTPHLAIAFVNIITYVIIYCSFKELGFSLKQKAQSLLVYALWNEFYLTSFSTIRQALSIALGLLVFSLLQRRKYIWSIIVMLIAIHIHSSAIILILLYPIYLLRNKLSFTWLAIITASLVCILSSINLFLQNIGILAQYQYYFGLTDDYGGKLIYVNIFLISYFLFVFYKSINLTNLYRQCYFLGLFGFIGGTILYFSGVSIIFTRMFSYFTIFLIFIIFPSLSIFKYYTYLRIITSFFLSLYFCAYLYIISDVREKRDLSTYIPYKCILFE